MDMNIDLVYMWVDGSDPKWLQKKQQYIDQKINTTGRFQDNSELKYSLRSIDKHIPWIRKIFIVTDNQVPKFLDTKHPKIEIVDHTEIIPKEYLPSFNSSVIEHFIYNIPNLSEHFLFSNDDMFLNADVAPDFFIINKLAPTRFFEKGLPKDIAAFRMNTGVSQFEKMLKNNIRLINQHFDKKEVFKRDGWKWFDPSYGSRGRLNHLLKYYNKFVTLRTPHNAQPFLKQTFEAVWEQFGEELEGMSKHRFRSDDDYTPELFRTWQICSSNFLPYNTYQDTKMFPLMIKSKKAIQAVREQSYSLVCLNDNIHIRNYQQTMESISAAFETILPEKSSFEV